VHLLPHTDEPTHHDWDDQAHGNEECCHRCDELLREALLLDDCAYC
jgi:hypothetical protein